MKKVNKLDVDINHIAVIMDGNRRWARENGYAPTYGHVVGANVLEKMVKFASKIGLKHFTVYAFSTENWNREKQEIDALMNLLEKYIKKIGTITNKENIKVKVLGNIEVLKPSLKKAIENIEDKTKNMTGLTFNIALNYGGRQEIVKAVKEITEKVNAGTFKIEDISENMISDFLYTQGQPDPDLVIRTSGEMRTSNFLPYQITYSELYFVNKHWPDFKEEDLLKAIEEYAKRTRKFGGK